MQTVLNVLGAAPHAGNAVLIGVGTLASFLLGVAVVSGAAGLLAGRGLRARGMGRNR
jgi:hypothetical protein